MDDFKAKDHLSPNLRYLTLKKLCCLQTLIPIFFPPDFINTFHFLLSLLSPFSLSLFSPSHHAACTPTHPHLPSCLFLWISTSCLKSIHSIPLPLPRNTPSFTLCPFPMPSFNVLPYLHDRSSSHPSPTEKEALLASGLQVHHTFPKQHLQQILQGIYSIYDLKCFICTTFCSVAASLVLPLAGDPSV